MSWFEQFLERLFRALADWVDRCIPAYEPEKWNNDPHIQECNNCYNYACDIITNNFAQPGYAHGAIYQTVACGDVTTAAVADGLVVTETPACGCADCSHVV